MAPWPALAPGLSFGGRASAPAPQPTAGQSPGRRHVVLRSAQSDTLATALGEHQGCVCEPKLMATEQQPRCTTVNGATSARPCRGWDW